VLLVVLLVPSLIFGAWSWITLSYSYSKGERAGYVQKISKKGWLCKTWEGELAMANLPGTNAGDFFPSVSAATRLLTFSKGRWEEGVDFIRATPWCADSLFCGNSVLYHKCATR
jgi:hypothetical protein